MRGVPCHNSAANVTVARNYKRMFEHITGHSICDQIRVHFNNYCSGCNVSYRGESGRRLEERLMDHPGRDKNSHVLKHSLDKGHKEVTMDNVTIISKNYYKRKVIKIKKAILNTQDNSVPLKLFN